MMARRPLSTSLLALGCVVLIAIGSASIGFVAAAPATATPGPAAAPEWWFDTWRVPQLWAAGADGRGITVAVLDTGVQADLAELAGHVGAGADFSGRGTDGRTDTDQQPFSHGTAMASLIVAGAGSTGIVGVAPAATVLPVVVPLADERPSTAAVPGGTAAAIRYAADHGAKIISMSFGGSRDPADSAAPCPDDVQDAVIYALGRGSVLLAAAGNSGTGQPAQPAPSTAPGNESPARAESPVVQPGVCLGVLSVGAIDRNQQVSSFSSRHPYLSAAAPGSQIATLSRRPGAGYLGFGTSQATALAAGAVALVWSRYPTETNAQIVSRLLGTAVDAGPSGHDSSYGYGILDPAAAVAVKAPAATNPVFTAAQPLIALATAVKSRPGVRPPAGGALPSGRFVPASPPSRWDAHAWQLFALSAVLLLTALGSATGLRRHHPVRGRADAISGDVTA